jgi:hypothetical protein
MDKKNFSVFLFIVIGIILNASFAFTQDSTKSKSYEEFTALKKGNYAIYFEFGSLLFRSRTGSNDNELLLTAKLHLTDRLALRISGGTGLGSEIGNGSYSGNGELENHKYASDNFSFITTINMQYFLLIKSKVNPFFSAGIYGKYSYSASKTSGYSWEKMENWGIGPFASFGAEMFVLDNISVIGEYIMKGTAGRNYHKHLSYSNNYLTGEQYDYSTAYSLDLSSFRAGLSVYF